MTSHDIDPTEAPSTPASGGGVWSEERIRALGAITDLPTAGRVFGLGRALSYELARTGGFPVPVIRVGARYKVPVAGILTALGLQRPPGDLTPGGMRSVDHHHEISSIDPPHSGGDRKKEP
ncbi:DNA-binding protein [Micromonospora sp. NPDC023814]|uniref:DNA-binding protein n=1 Tax=Micromonospora sp. NPDC023814 TaxID=3154596 RepID=UPI0033C8B728